MLGLAGWLAGSFRYSAARPPLVFITEFAMTGPPHIATTVKRPRVIFSHKINIHLIVYFISMRSVWLFILFSLAANGK